MLEKFRLYSLSRGESRQVIGGVVDTKAKCAGGGTVSCSGSNCEAHDASGVGTPDFTNGSCSCNGPNGNVVDSHTCDIQ